MANEHSALNKSNSNEVLDWASAVKRALWRVHLRSGKLAIKRQTLVSEELSMIIAETRTSGATPEQSLSRTLQELRDGGLIEFIDIGTYRILPLLLSQMAPALELHRTYTRAEAHAMLAPVASFETQRGQWGLQGIVPIAGRSGDFAFFVSFGQSQGDHVFEEGITTEGVLTWQSQPSQSLTDGRIKQFIDHDDLKNRIYLFLRTQTKGPYTYLGTLRFIDYDSSREMPVHFHWQLIAGAPPASICSRLGLQLQDTEAPGHDSKEDQSIEVAPPRGRSRGRPNREFVARRWANRPEDDAANRKLGRQGELFVLRYERDRLRNGGFPHLADRVVDVAGTLGDGAGYDILSYALDGTERYLEVKTTSGSIRTPFLLTTNEVACSQTFSDKYELVRVFEFNLDSGEGHLFRVRGDLSTQFSLEPTEFRARLLEH
jgi:hypothetical protein